METKSWYKSKAFWAGIGQIVIGIGQVVTGDTQAGIAVIVTGIVTIIGRATATAPLGK